ncbi:hypothetical protein GCM10022415_05220 [Knoellia locipacati]|uniref:Uncharacterized protein n=1 Tax=Knoellia locipacati TaxID=882824 RepID=A0A512SWY9_9MICO|nr:hypothetical protein [Knoellia locipacati]GEQ12473.1 hypothetical protein KLO01_05200 [Knoellia locipacati]
MSQQHDDTTRIETLLDESDRAPQPESAPQPDEAPEQAAPATPFTTASTMPYQGTTVVPEYKSGPAPMTSVVGLLGLLTVIAVLLAQATDLDIPWGVVGPVAVVGSGVLLVVLGLAGLRGQRYRGR